MAKYNVKNSNHLMWDGVSRPFLEDYTLRYTDPIKDNKLVLKYIIRCSDEVYPSGSAKLVGLYSKGNSNPILCEKIYDLSDYDIMHKENFVKLDKAYFSLAEASGSTKCDKNYIDWELRFEDPNIYFKTMPRLVGRLLTGKQYRYFSPRHSSFVNGDVFINEKKLSLRREVISQSHQFGLSWPEKIVHFFCSGFSDENLSLELLQIEQPQKTFAKKWFAFCIKYKETVYTSHSPIRIKSVSELNQQSWLFSFVKSGMKFEGDIYWSKEDLVRWLEKSSKIETECMIHLKPILNLRIYEKVNKMWSLKKEWHNMTGGILEMNQNLNDRDNVK